MFRIFIEYRRGAWGALAPQRIQPSNHYYLRRAREGMSFIPQSEIKTLKRSFRNDSTFPAKNTKPFLFWVLTPLRLWISIIPVKKVSFFQFFLIRIHTINVYVSSMLSPIRIRFKADRFTESRSFDMINT